MIYNKNINLNNLLKDGLHLFETRKIKLAVNFIYFLKKFFFGNQCAIIHLTQTDTKIPTQRNKNIFMVKSKQQTVNMFHLHTPLPNMEKEVKSSLDNLQNSNYLSEDDYKFMKPYGSKQV